MSRLMAGRSGHDGSTRHQAYAPRAEPIRRKASAFLSLRALFDELAFKKCVRRENWDPPKRMKNLEIAIPAYDDIGVSANYNLQKRIVVWIATQ